MKPFLVFAVAGLCANLVTISAAEAAFVLTVADVSDMQDPDGNDANMAAGAFAGNDAMGGGAVGEAQLTTSFGDLGWAFAANAIPRPPCHDTLRGIENGGTYCLSF